MSLAYLLHMFRHDGALVFHKSVNPLQPVLVFYYAFSNQKDFSMDKNVRWPTYTS